MNLPKQKHRKQYINENSLAIPLALFATGALAYYLLKRADAKGTLPLAASRRGVHLEGSVSIERSAKEIYNYWRDFVQLANVMTFLDRVEDRGAGITHWVIAGPKSSTIEWDSEVVTDLPNERLSWQSIPGSDMHTWGEVRFQDSPHGRGTEVLVDMYFEPPGKMAGSAVGYFLKGLEKAVLNQNLRNLKAYMETGEVPTNKRQAPSGHSLENPL